MESGFYAHAYIPLIVVKHKIMKHWTAKPFLAFILKISFNVEIRDRNIFFIFSNLDKVNKTPPERKSPQISPVKPSASSFDSMVSFSYGGEDDSGEDNYDPANCLHSG